MKRPETLPSASSKRTSGRFLSHARSLTSVSLVAMLGASLSWAGCEFGCEFEEEVYELGRTNVNDLCAHYTIFIVFCALSGTDTNGPPENSGRRSRRFKSCHPDHFQVVPQYDELRPLRPTANAPAQCCS